MVGVSRIMKPLYPSLSQPDAVNLTGESAGLAPLITSATIHHEVMSGQSEAAFVLNAEMKRQRAFRLVDWLAREGAKVEGDWVFIRLSLRDWSCYESGLMAKFCKRLQTDCLRKTGKRCLCWWVAEYQQRGVVHWHIVARFPVRLNGRPYRIGKPDRARPSGRGRHAKGGCWWPYGFTRIERVRGEGGEHAVVGYVLKYCGKDMAKQQGRVEHARHYGLGGLSAQQREDKTWQMAPKRVQAESGGHRVRRVPGGSTWQAGGPGGWRDIPSAFVAYPWKREQGQGVYFSGPWLDGQGGSLVPRLRHLLRLRELWDCVLAFEHRTFGCQCPEADRSLPGDAYSPVRRWQPRKPFESDAELFSWLRSASWFFLNRACVCCKAAVAGQSLTGWNLREASGQ